MPKGHTNNPNGRPTGSKNQRTKEWEALGEAILTKHTEKFNSILSKSKDDEFMNRFLAVIEYFKPKLARVESKSDVQNETVIRFEFNNHNPPKTTPETGGVSDQPEKV